MNITENISDRLQNKIDINEISNISDKTPNKIYRRDSSVLEYILNYRYDILSKIDEERSENRRYIMVDETELSQSNKNKHYYSLILWYFAFLIYGFFGGIFINLISGFQIINYDMMFNVMISPIIYYHSPRNILMNLNKKSLLLYYIIPFIVGLQFRFFDRIPGFSQFVLDPYYIKSTLQIILLITTLLILFSLSLYYIYISSNPILNSILFFIELLTMAVSSYIYLVHNGNIHIHHYFIGLLLMLVSKNYHSKVVIITHSISYAIYIEGISGYGFDTLFWKSTY